MSVRVSVNWRGKEVAGAAHAAAVEGLFEGAEHLLEEANRTVPHDTGALQSSGETSLDEAKVQASVYYDTPYAARLHEHPEYHFQDGRRGKWLELALKERAAAIRGRIAAKIKNALGG